MTQKDIQKYLEVTSKIKELENQIGPLYKIQKELNKNLDLSCHRLFETLVRLKHDAGEDSSIDSLLKSIPEFRMLEYKNSAYNFFNRLQSMSFSIVSVTEQPVSNEMQYILTIKAEWEIYSEMEHVLFSLPYEYIENSSNETYWRETLDLDKDLKVRKEIAELEQSISNMETRISDIQKEIELKRDKIDQLRNSGLKQ